MSFEGLFCPSKAIGSFTIGSLEHGSFTPHAIYHAHHTARHFASATTSFFGISFNSVKVSATCCW
jgi:hypothetical protein